MSELIVHCSSLIFTTTHHGVSPTQPSSTHSTDPRSLSPACTSIKQRYDACFNAWFEGYLQPALDTTSRARQPAPGPADPGAPAVDVSASTPKRIITNWSSAFRRREYPTTATPTDATTDEAPTFQQVPTQLPPIDTRGKTRAQIKAEEYDRNCGSAWREYNACLKASRTPPSVTLR